MGRLDSLGERLRAVPARWVFIGAAALGLALALVGTYRACNASSDFPGLYNSAHALLTTGRYADDQERYPPTHQLVFLPFAALPYPVAAVVWNLVNLAGLLALPWMLARLGGVCWRGQFPAWLAVTPFVWDNLAISQSGPVLVALAAGGILAASRRKGILGGALLAVGAAYKAIPTVFVFVTPAIRRGPSAFLGFALALLVLGAGVVWLAGWDQALQQAHEWYAYVRDHGNTAAIVKEGLVLRYNNQGLAVTIARTFCDTGPADARGAVRLANLPRRAGLTAYAVIVAAAGAGWLAAAWRARRLPTETAALGMFGLTALAMLLVSPLAWTHYFIWWLPGLVFLSPRPRLVVGIALISVLALAFVPARALGAHIWLSLFIYGMVVHDLFRPAAGPKAIPTAA